jgi:hypothetical protein
MPRRFKPTQRRRRKKRKTDGNGSVNSRYLASLKHPVGSNEWIRQRNIEFTLRNQLSFQTRQREWLEYEYA